MARWFWFFLIYSFLGFLLEVAFARAIGSGKPDRKCLFLLPLCPVYGLGMMAIAALPGWVVARPVLLVLAGGALATGVEYLTGLFYERAAGVRFWDYTHLPLQLHGRVCLSFSLAWGVLAAAVMAWLHPWVAALAQAIPIWWLPPAALLLAGDSLYSLALLRRAGNTDVLRWRRAY